MTIRVSHTKLPPHIPATSWELKQRGWNRLDAIIVTADAHVDHPSFPAALLSRVLEDHGFRVGVIARPTSPDDIERLGEPRLFFGVTAGAMDSMVANYTSLKKRRSDDSYAPGGLAGTRPDRALTVYCHMIRRVFGKKVLLVAGGMEASLRRFAHYDYWSDKVRRSILMDCGADILVHGMGEKPLVEIAQRLDSLSHRQISDPVNRLSSIMDIRGVVYRQPASKPAPEKGIELPSTRAVASDKSAHVTAFRLQERHQDKILYQTAGGMRVIANPAGTQTAEDLDRIYSLAFRREVHPIHGGLRVPALEQVQFSITSHRGCFGGCAFCAITTHQGRDVISRSRQSILAEVALIAAHPSFKGTINDIGGPTANMWGFSCSRQKSCSRVSCLWPTRCPHLRGDQNKYTKLLRSAKNSPGIKHLFVTTGIRMDLATENLSFISALAEDFTSGHLKVAPEHTSSKVLNLMRKPAAASMSAFCEAFTKATKKAHKRQFVLPYLMAAHPGSRLEDMLEVALYLREENLRVEQVQIFTPTPATASTVMYATGLCPDTGKEVFVEKTDKGKRLQKALLLSHLSENEELVRQALKKLHRPELMKKLAPASKRSLSPRHGHAPTKRTKRKNSKGKKHRI